MLKEMTIAVLKTYIGHYDEAIAYYQLLLQSTPRNKYNLNNLGYTLILQENYNEAIVHLNKAIAIDSRFAAPFVNRAFARMQTGLLEDGKKDNDYALLLQEKNSYAYRNKGFYEMKKGSYDAALESFSKALELDPDTRFVRQYVADIHEMIKGCA